MKKFEPPTLKMVEDYVREENLNVDPHWFWNFFNAGGWVNSKGKPVRSWKQTLWTHHRFNMERAGHRPCKVRGCKGYGVYIDGKDRDGHPYYYCINHKPPARPVAKEIRHLTEVALSKDAGRSATIDLNDARNKQRKALGL